MIPVSIVLGGLCLHSLEIEQTIEVCNLIISLFALLTPLAILLRDLLEISQLETGINRLIFEIKYNKFDSLITKE